MLTSDQYTRLIADAYYAAALANADMRDASERLEAIRVAFVGGQDLFKIWDTMDLHIGQTENQPLLKVLMSLREHFTQGTCDAEVARLSEIFSNDSETGWLEWLSIYAKTLTEWRLLLCLALCRASLSFPERVKHDVARIHQLTQYIFYGRSVDGYSLYIYLTEQEALSHVLRARLYIQAAETQLYDFVMLEEAKVLLQRAEELSPEEAFVQRGWGGYWLQEAKFEKARICLQEAIKRDPLLIEAYLTMGACYERQDDFDAAEEWYREAIRVHSGYNGGYLGLLRLYGRKGQLAQHEAQLLPLLERVIALDPEYTYLRYLDMGSVYQQNQRYKDAYDWYNKAVELNEAELNAYISIGYTALEEATLEEKNSLRAKQAFQKACSAFQKAVTVALESFDGYWGMALCYEQQEQWEDALDWYEKSLPLRPEWEGALRGRLGEMKLKLQHYEEAEEELINALRCEPGNQEVTYLLQGLADTYAEGQEPTSALRIYEVIRQIKGQSYEADYQNSVGNVKYYSGEYRAALEAYKKAIALKPNDPDFHSNLAYTWENVRVPGQRLTELEHAISALRKVLELEPKNNDYAKIEDLELEQKLVMNCGERALNFLPEIPPISIGCTADLIPSVSPNGESTLDRKLQDMITALFERFRRNFGINIPTILFEEIPSPKSSSCVIKLSDIPYGSGRLSPSKRFFPGSLDELPTLQVEVEEEFNPQTGGIGYWIDQTDWEIVEQYGLRLWQVMEYPLAHLERLLQRRLVEFITHQWVAGLLESRSGSQKTEVYEQIKKLPENITALTLILKGLVSEQVSIAAFDLICEKFIELVEAKTNLQAIVESVRSIPDIRSTLPGNNDRYRFLQLGQNFEVGLEQLIFNEHLVMKSDEWQGVLELVQSIVESQQNVALLVQKTELRPFVRKCLEVSFPDIPVLSRQELLPELEGRIEGELEMTEEALDQEVAITQEVSEGNGE